MNEQIESIRKKRSSLLEQINTLDTAALNQIPEGHNNNLAWNLGHMVAVQQGVCYRRANLPTMISTDFWERYRPGTKPERIISEAELTEIKQLLFSTLDQFETDYGKHIFSNYTAWPGRHGVEVANIDDAIKFLAFHDGLHIDVISKQLAVISR